MQQVKRWYIVQVYSGKEQHVMDAIREHIKIKGMESKFGDMIVPTEEVLEMKGGKKRKSKRKFFPGYILIEMEMDDDTWHLIRHITGVLGFIGGMNAKPTPLSEKEIDNILQRVQEGQDKPRPKVLFEPGEIVRITEGPFADFDGVVEDVNYEKSRLRVSVSIFGRATPVELEFGQVQKV
jgi:transcription termination/antitermination protein NusG